MKLTSKLTKSLMQFTTDVHDKITNTITYYIFDKKKK